MRKTHKLQLLSQRRRKKPSSRLSFALGLPLSYLGYASLGLAGLLLLSFLFPVTISGADALDNTTRSAMTRISVDAAATVAVSLDVGVEMEIIPKTSGQFQAISTNLGVTTNNPEGYSLYISTADSDNALKSAKSSAADAPTIKSITSETLGSDFVDNTWGYTLQPASTSPSVTTSYQPLPTSPTSPVKVTTGSNTTAGVTDEYSLSFGVHIDNTLPAGEYTNAVVASAVANPITITHLGDLVYMQDMTPEICANTAEGVEKQLFDLRDGQKYFVAKLRDGNCWMTQNLALDLKQGEVLTSELTDVMADYTVPRSTENTIPARDMNDASSTRSWSFGKIVLKDPTLSELCNSALPEQLKAEGYESSSGSSAWYGQTLLGQCGEMYQDVEGLAPNAVATARSALSEDGTAYDPHYLIGNYYGSYAMTAGSSSDTRDENTANGNAGLTNVDKLVDTKSSICPKGWKLPTTGLYNLVPSGTMTAWPYEREDSFYNLLAAYGYPATGENNADANVGWLANGGTPITKFADVHEVRPDFNPMYFVKTGYIRIDYGALFYAGNYGYSWSSTVVPGSNKYTYSLMFDRNIIAPAYVAERYYGITVRCLAR